MSSRPPRAAIWLVCAACWSLASGLSAATPLEISGGSGRPLSIVARDTPLAEIYEMLSRKEQISVLIGKGVSGTVSVTLFNVTLDQAVRSIAEAAGYVAERRRGSYVILTREEAGRDSANGNTIVRTLKIDYADPEAISNILAKHQSRYGEITVFPERRMLVIEDLPDFIRRIERIVTEIDREPDQILIEAKILEITLDENDVFGIDWEKFFTYDGSAGSFGVRGQTSAGTAGVFFGLAHPDLEAALNALSKSGRVRTLSTPSLLALEHEEAEVLIAERLGFRVTTTINEVTTESVEFLESGVILRFKASVDRLGRIRLEIHPEVSTGTISDGLPNQTTAEVTTTLLVEDGQKIFIGGLLKDTVTQTRSGVPVLMDIPYLGFLFSRREDISVSTETVVLISAHVASRARQAISEEKSAALPGIEEEMEKRRAEKNRRFEIPPQELLRAAPLED
ncbi:MAG: secretin N-terminal domain-containing protein [Myxococcota bacterium]